jgi:hypothetical protein
MRTESSSVRTTAEYRPFPNEEGRNTRQAQLASRTKAPRR